MKIILGSQSQNRKAVLAKAGYVFEVMSPDIDERAIRHEDAYEIPLLLSKAKAAALLPKIHEDALLITADQIICWNGEVREKAKDREEARYFLLTYGAQSLPAEHVNGITVTNTKTGKSATRREISRAYFSPIPETVIEASLQNGKWNTCAGGYDIQNPLLIPYIRLEGTMDSACGLPLAVLKECIDEVS